jgi:hypothetical protein
MYTHDVYDFDRPLQCYPSLCKGKYLTDALYFSGNSFADWKLPFQVTGFEANIEVLDYSTKENIRPIFINGQEQEFGPVSIPIKNRRLTIETRPGDRTFYALTYPRLHYEIETPSTVFE